MTDSPAPQPVRRSRRRIATVVGAVLVPLSLVGLALAAVGDGEAALDRIPAAIVNNDELVTIVDADGDEQPFLAGRQLVTELTGPDSVGFHWTPTGEEEAARALEAGEVYAVVTIPSDFSASLTTISDTDAQPASIRIDTDDAHSYLAGSVMQAIGSGLVAQFGSEITARYLDELAGGLGELGESLETAAGGAGDLAVGSRELAGGVRELGDGVTGLGDGASALGSGLSSATSGARDSATGAAELSSGIAGYTQGVDALATGLVQLDAAAGSLGALSGAVADVSSLATALVTQAQAVLDEAQASSASAQTIAEAQAMLVEAQTLAAIAAGTSAQVTPALSGIEAGVGDSASGASALSSESPALRGGASGLAAGLDQLATGLGQSRDGAFSLAAGAEQLAAGNAELADGASELAAGTEELAAGLDEGAASVPDDVATVPDTVTDPIALETDRANALDGIGGLIIAVLGPLGLWFGAMAVTLALPVRAAATVGSPLGAGALLRRRLLLLSAVSLAQAALVTLLAHTVAGISWTLAPAILGLTTLIAVAFAALHVALAQWLGRGGIVVSLLALAVQVVVIGGVVPIEALAAPFPALSAVLPLSHATDGLTSIIAGGSPDRVLSAAVSLVLLTAISLVVARLAAGRARRRAVLRRFAPSMA
ncbi:MAG: YhgE/Pip family protein [Microcella sp.]|uniref:YhgE/Pip family protein n=1 Tax=Microcella sp. TaxID=1913979 RepID=UPI0033161CA9